MSFSPAPVDVVGYVSAFVHANTREGNAAQIPTSGAWPAANRAVYSPVIIPRACVVYRFFWLNGATVGTNNLQVGLYTDAFASVLLGTSTLSAGANVCQFDNVADTAIGPGRYWLALWCSGTTATVFRSASAGGPRHSMVYNESSLASGLPATATPIAPVSAFLPVFGFTTVASP